MTSETEEAVARVAKMRANLAGLRDPDIQADRQALDTILTALAASQAEVERLTRERDEARGHRLKDKDWPLAIQRLQHCEPGPDQGLAMVGAEDLAFALQRLSEFANAAMGNAMEVGRLEARATRAEAERAEALTERDVAQSACTAWQGVYEGLEAHLKDRIAMRDEADPEAYLRILPVLCSKHTYGGTGICGCGGLCHRKR